ncbi:MAG: hypothetical protein WBB86_04165, partial [Candidatus Omnitrophota bacterium]
MKKPWDVWRAVDVLSGTKMRVQRSLNALKDTSIDHDALRKLFVFNPYYFFIFCSILDLYSGPIEEILDYIDDSGHIDLKWFLKGKGAKLILKVDSEDTFNAVEGLVKMLGLERDNFVIAYYGSVTAERVQSRFPEYRSVDIYKLGNDPGHVWINFSEGHNYSERGVAYIPRNFCETGKIEEEDIPAVRLFNSIHLALKAGELSTPPKKDSSAFFAMPLFLGEQTLDFSWTTFAIVVGGLLFAYLAYRIYRAWTARKQTGAEEYRYKLADEDILWRMVASRKNIPLDKLDEWKRQNPDQVKLLEKQLETILANNDFYGQLIENWDSTMGTVDPSDERFKAFYSDTREVFDRALKARGYDPDDFNLVILDDGYSYPRGFVLPYSNTVCINMGLIRFVVDNGGTVDSFAHILAHELAHVDQFVDDIFEGKELTFPRDFHSWDAIQKLQGRHADEYQADIESLSTIDKAGYTVRGALDMMKAFRERERGQSALQMILTMLSHPLTDERIRKLEKQVNGLHWPSYYNDPTEFSEEFKEAVNLKTRNREFKDWVYPQYPHPNLRLQDIDTALELIRRSDSPEKLFLALDFLIMYVFPTEERSPEERPLAHDEEAQRRIRSAFEEQASRVAGEDKSMIELFRIFFELGTMEGNLNREAERAIAERIGLDNILSALKARLPYEMEPRLKSFFQGLMNKFLLGVIPYTLEEKMTEMVKQDPGRIKDVRSAVEGLEKWKKQMAVMDAVSWDSFVGNEGPSAILQAQQSILGGILGELEIVNNLTPEDVRELLSLADRITVLDLDSYQHSPVVHAMFDLLIEAGPEISSLVWGWLCEDRGEKSALKDRFWLSAFSYFFHSRKDFPGSIEHAFTEWFGDINPETIFSRLGNAEYLFKRSGVNVWEHLLPIIGLVDEDETPLFSFSPEKQMEVVDWLLERTDLYDVETHEFTTGGDIARSVFKRVKRIPISLIEEKLARQGIHLDPSVHPDVKLLIYFYSKGGIADERIFRRIVLEEDLSERDLLVLYEHIKRFGSDPK